VRERLITVKRKKTADVSSVLLGFGFGSWLIIWKYEMYFPPKMIVPKAEVLD
jgi:hypothetical protein